MSSPLTAEAPVARAEAPPPLTVLDTEALRRRIAGLAAPARAPGGSASEETHFRDTAVRFFSILAHLFGDDLQAETKWAKIEAAVESACAKVPDGDTGRWAQFCLASINSDAVRRAACEPLVRLIDDLANPVDGWGLAYLRYVRERYMVLIPLARARWQEVKARRAEL